jgi:hypothetical protein
MKVAISILSAALLAAVPGRAQTLSTLTYEFGIPVTQSVTEINQTGQLGLFDSDLGTLLGATLEIHGAGTTSISLTNRAATASNIRANISTRLTFGSDISALDAMITGTANGILLSYTTGFNLYQVNETKSFGPFAANQVKFFDLMSILSQMQASGGGDFDITGISLSSLSIQGGGGNVDSDQTTLAGVGARIVYTYEPVDIIPEPGSALLTVWLCSMGLLRRRRSHS